MKCLSLIFISFLVFSCGHLNHSNFNKQKFTNLKSQPQNEDEVVSTKAEIIYEADSKSNNLESSTDDFLKPHASENSAESITQTHADNNSSDNIPSNYVPLDAEEYTDSTEKILMRALVLKYNFLIEIDSQWFKIDSAIFVEMTHSIEGNLVPIKNIKEYNHERTITLKTNAYVNPKEQYVSLHKDQIIALRTNPFINSNKIPDEKYLGYDPTVVTPQTFKDKEIADSLIIRKRFDLIFQIGLALFILTVLLYLMAIFAESSLMLFFSLGMASIGILIVWILSYVLVSMASQIKEPHRNTGFKVEFALAAIVAAIGTAVVAGIAILIIALML